MIASEPYTMAKYCEKQQSIIQGGDWHQYIFSVGIFDEPTEKQVFLSKVQSKFWICGGQSMKLVGHK